MNAKYTNAIILVVVATGTAAVALVGDASRGIAPLETLFLGFVAAIIAIQVVPAMMMLGHLVKALLTKTEKEFETVNKRTEES